MLWLQRTVEREVVEEEGLQLGWGCGMAAELLEEK